jgi:hypothetical protein
MVTASRAASRCRRRTTPLVCDRQLTAGSYETWGSSRERPVAPRSCDHVLHCHHDVKIRAEAELRRIRPARPLRRCRSSPGVHEYQQEAKVNWSNCRDLVGVPNFQCGEVGVVRSWG